MQAAVVRFASHVEDYIPEITVFSVEVFNALYLTKSMQTAKSAVTYLAIMAFDVLEMAVAFWEMKHQLSALHRLQMLHQADHASQSLLELVLSVCNEPGVLEPKENTLIRINSPLQLRVLIASAGAYTQTQTPTVLPAPKSQFNAWHGPTQPAVAALTNTTVAEKREFVHHALKILFQCEYHVLVEYVECIIPMIYSLYVGILVQLPSAKYYPETRDVPFAHVTSMALNVMVYAWLELLSLFAFHLLVKKKFGFSPAYVLAFVLENQAIELVARLTVWFVYILELTLVHFGKSFIASGLQQRSLTHLMVAGVDFSLQFAWMQTS
jgi:hypothetical protein